ncbi:MAG: ABC transporter ATP-binding protein [Chloroflexi bacterium]|nr:ABC transporter ATP-binding protein [Chloroflexota bacterium]
MAAQPITTSSPRLASPGVPALAVHGLRKTYGTFEAVRGIDFEVKQGEIFGLLGPNGAGKTTTIEIVIGLRPMTAGRVEILGHDVTSAATQARTLIGVQLQESDFFEHLTLAEQLRFLGACYGMAPDTDALLGYVDLGDRAGWKLKQLSGGQKQRFALAASLVNDPPVVLLDEPSTGLDPTARRQLWELIRALRGDGRTVLLSTHYMEEAEVLCDRVAIMDKGVIAAIDTPLELIHQLVATGFKRDVVVRDATLEDVFIQLTGHGFEDESAAELAAANGRHGRGKKGATS